MAWEVLRFPPPAPAPAKPPARMGSPWGNASPGICTVSGAGALCPGDILKLAPGPSLALKIRLRGEAQSAAGSPCRDAASKTGRMPSGKGHHMGRRQPCWKLRLQKEAGLNARVGPDGHTLACTQVQDSLRSSPWPLLRTQGTWPRHRAHRPGPGARLCRACAACPGTG